MTTAIFIPARLGSTRLPNKIIADINGIPLIARVVTQAKKADIGKVYVACDSKQIAEIAENYGAHAIITDPDLPSGSDRIYAALSQIDATKKITRIVNLQGDLPNISPQAIQQSIIPIDNGFEVGTLASIIDNKQDLANNSVVKIAMNAKDDNLYNALYFSRSAIPYNAQRYYHHIGIYSYTRNAIEKFIQLPVGELEQIEKLEQLRLLENNFKIGVATVNETPISIDTKQDLENARKKIL